MITRRTFFNKLAWTGAGLGVSGWLNVGCQNDNKISVPDSIRKPLVVSTWNNVQANEAAWQVFSKQGSALDAVEAGVKIPEADPNDQSVGYGGRPDCDGNVTLDACIMDHQGNAGGVCYLQHIKHPISVARKVMETTPHVLLAGDGALQFALEQGFVKENLLTEKSKREWEEWSKTAQYQPVVNIEMHDTIGMVALDEQSNLAGACTTSGMAYKIKGRVGDSPIIGAGLFVDNEVGAATSTGQGELVLKTLGSFLVVELMRQGYSPVDACQEAVMRVIKKIRDLTNMQVGYLALNKNGEVGGYSIQPGFLYALTVDGKTEVINAASYIKK